MVKMPSADEIDKKYRESIGRVPGAYKEKISKVTGWKEAAVAAEDLWAAKMQEAISAKRRAKALEGVSDDEWKRKAMTLGAERIARGMAENADKRKKNYEPYRTALEAVDLPPRTADPLANVDNRVKPIVKALVETKKSIKG